MQIETIIILAMKRVTLMETATTNVKHYEVLVEDINV